MRPRDPFGQPTTVIHRNPNAHYRRLEEAAAEGSDLVLISIVGAKFNLSPRLIARWKREGHIRGYELPGSWRRVSVRAIGKFLREQEAPPPGAAAVVSMEARLAERRKFERRREALHGGRDATGDGEPPEPAGP